MPKIGADPACYDLARHFLVSEVVSEPAGDGEVERSLASLAEAIQRAVDDWFLAAWAQSEP